MGPVVPIVAIAATAIGAGLQAVSSIQQGRAAKKQAQYQSQIAALNQQQAQKNAELQALNARYTEAAGAKAADDQTRRLRATVGAQRASLAANGLLADEGTGVDLQNATVTLGQAAIDQTRRNAQRQATGYRIAGENSLLDAQAASVRGEAYRASGSAAMTAGLIGAGSSIIGGISNGFSQYSSASRAGVYSDMEATGSSMSKIPAIV